MASGIMSPALPTSSELTAEQDTVTGSPGANRSTAIQDEVDSEKLVATSSARQVGFFSRRRILGPVEKPGGDYALLACCLVTGLVDAASFGNWGIFVGMQTGKITSFTALQYVYDTDDQQGNTVILGLSTAGLPANPYAWLTTLISVVTFLIVAIFTFRMSAYVSPDGPYSNRLWLSTLFLAQGLLILISAALATAPNLIPQNPGNTSRTTPEPRDVLHNIRIVSLLPPLAFQSGMQIASSRLLGYNELPVNVLTSTYCDLMGDFRLFALNNVKRDRRAAAVVLLLVGAIVSGWLMRSRGGLSSVLWISAGIKIMAGIAMYVFMPVAKTKAKA
nr:hypothetical protein B0A51_13283 [Rachicladosporium sp. CCFEE 5018]